MTIYLKEILVHQKKKVNARLVFMLAYIFLNNSNFLLHLPYQEQISRNEKLNSGLSLTRVARLLTSYTFRKYHNGQLHNLEYLRFSHDHVIFSCFNIQNNGEFLKLAAFMPELLYHRSRGDCNFFSG